MDDGSNIEFIIIVSIVVVILVVLMGIVVVLCVWKSRQAHQENSAKLETSNRNHKQISSSMHNRNSSSISNHHLYSHDNEDGKTVANHTTTVMMPQTTHENTQQISYGSYTWVSSEAALSIPAFLGTRMKTDFEMLEKFNEGGTCSIMKAKVVSASLRDRAKSDIVVAKIFNDVVDQDMFDGFIQEVSILWLFKDHSNIVKIVGYCENPPIILMKHYKMGSVHEWLHVIPTLKLPLQFRRNKTNIMKICHGISSGLETMHNAGFVHCDIKPANILIERDRGNSMKALITDFGVTQIVEAKRILVKAFRAAIFEGASFAYASPEALIQMRTEGELPYLSPDIYKSRDIFSFSVTTLEILCKLSVPDIWILSLQYY